MLQVTSKDICKICSVFRNLFSVQTPERRHGVLVSYLNFEQLFQIALYLYCLLVAVMSCYQVIL